MTDATLSYVNGEPTLRLERHLKHAPAKVWRAVTDPAEMKHWFPSEVEMELRPGAPMRFVFPDETPVDNEWDGEVLEVDEPKVFMFNWAGDVVRIELVPEDDGCRLVFTQTISGGEIGFLSAGRNASGWDECLDHLVARLDGTSAPERTDWLGPVAHYVEKFGLGDGTVTSTEDGYELRFVRDLMWKPPADTWEALTEGIEVGAEPPDRAVNDPAPPGRVVRVEPPHVLEYEWLHDDKPAGTVRWEFHSAKLGERVELTQTVPAELADMRARAMAVWHVHLDMFFAVVMGDDVRCGTWSDERVAELTKHYEAKLG